MVTTRILSFDPASYVNLGWGLMDIAEEDEVVKSIDVTAGTFLLPKVAQPWQMLWPLFNLIDQLLIKDKPDLIIIEKTSSFSGSFITGQVSNCIGVILACCGKSEIPVTFVFPTHVKKVITGKGKATKLMMKNSVSELIKKHVGKELKFDSEHAYDAIANIFCFLKDSAVLNEEEEDGQSQ